MLKNPRKISAQEAATHVALQGLQYLVKDEELLGRFLAATGIGPENLRGAAKNKGFLMAILDFLMEDETVLTAFAGQIALTPLDIAKARNVFEAPWERDSA